MDADTQALLPKPTDALRQPVKPLFGPRTAESVGDLLPPRLEALAEALVDPLLFLLPLLGVAVETNLLPLQVIDPLQGDGGAGSGLDGDRGRRIELAPPLPADHQIAIAPGAQPG